MNELDAIALDLCAEYGLAMNFAREAVTLMTTYEMTEQEAIDELRDMYGDIIYE